ncbi:MULTISPECIES: linear amide C-N hydrolase [unclassified Agarivorans]|uniref:linear amide C-N hydrolase n=1 Tax=unclassified Agarivorans TaxID=2636026 RepID=UPI0026E45981|nr:MULTISPECIES: linear amide C-N hydrolase [unclassified Agarivorans]MDO6684465.1 linear amide C-N hydrolase [Agarivorans sp. 3_MG-2023]MDO6714630.1 linear amide C-N hydrolase [Agarivorans sp. 2_MG-2023]
MKKTLLALTMAAATFGTIQVANACSYATFEVDGKAFVSRSMEAPDFMQERFTVFPQNHVINGKSGDYGFVGMQHGDTEWISSGLNEHGLNVEALALGESTLLPEGEGDVNYLEVVSHVLSNAKTVDEAVKLLEGTLVSHTTIAVAHDMDIPMHFALRDTDRAVVVEYTTGDGKPTFYENELGVMTNDPSYPVQLEAANKAIKDAGTRLAVDLETFDKLDSSPTGRFSRLAVLNSEFKRNPKAGDSREDGLARAFSILNDMEIVTGSMYWEFVSPDPQMVGYGNVVDLENNDYYYRTIDNPTIRKVDVDSIDFSKVKYSQTDIYSEPAQYTEITVSLSE